MDTILQRIKEAYHLETDAEVADFLGIKPSTLSMQKKRGRLNLELIIEKCSDLNKNWLFDGVGPMRKTELGNKVNQIPIYSSVSLEDEQLDLKKSNRAGSLAAEAEYDDYQLGDTSRIFGFVVNGDERPPGVQKNDIAIINMEDSLADDAIFLLSLNQKPLLTQVEEKADTYVLTTNEESFQVTRDDYTVIGRVTWIIRKM